MTDSPVKPSDALEILVDIYEGRANRPYGLTLINQQAHAIQSGLLARAQNLPAALVVAALLHDIGHMVHNLGDHPAALGMDDRHEEIGAQWLAQFFAEAVTEPIRWHVAAKRYLCSIEKDYLSKLSRDSLESLNLQGGVMSAHEVSAFEQIPYWEDAVKLRRLDEMAKNPAGPVAKFRDFEPEILACLAPVRMSTPCRF